MTAAEVSGAIAVDETTNHISETKAAIDSELREELKQLGVFGYTKTLHSPYSDRLSAPLEIYFDYTWVCNLMNKKCGLDSFCYAREFLGKQTMEKDIVRSVMKDMADWGVMRVHLAGGEPTSLREDLGNYLQAAYDNGLVTSMSNNGLLMTERMSETILDRDIYSVTFSFDGHTEETYGAVRGAGLFPKAVQGVKTFSKVRERYKAAGTGNTKISIKPTFTPETPKEIFRGLVEMSLDLGAEIVKFGNPERCLYHDKGYYGGIRDVTCPL